MNRFFSIFRFKMPTKKREKSSDDSNQETTTSNPPKFAFSSADKKGKRLAPFNTDQKREELENEEIAK